MRILIIPTSDWLRGSGRGHIDSIAEKLANMGHDIYVWHFDLFGDKPVKRKPNKLKLIEPITLRINDLATFYAINGLLQIPTLFKTLRQFRIDCVISENLLHGALAFMLSNRRVLKIFDFSDYFPESASIHYTKSTSSVRGLINAVVLWITKLSIKLSDVSIAPCYSLLRMIEQIDEEKKSYLVTNGVDTELFTPSEVEDTRNIVPSQNVIILVGLIEPWLDFDTMIAGLSILREKIPDVKLLLLGPRHDKYQQEIQDRFVKNGLEDHVVWTDYVPHKSVPKYINMAKCCLMPFRTDLFLSKIVLPVKLFEYSACGKPVLSTPLPEIIPLKAEHVLFYRDAVEFARNAALLLCDKELQDRLSKEARTFAKKYDYALIAKRLESIIAEEIRNKRKDYD